MWKNPPDPGWIPFLKLGFGFILLILLAALVAIIAVAKVEEHSSYGLPFLLGGLTTLSGGFAGWAFGTTGGRKDGSE